MRDDPTIERIRSARHDVSEANQHDPKKVVEYYRRLQEHYKGRLLHHPGALVSNKSLNAIANGD